MEKNITEVVIAGKVIRLTSEEDAEYMNKVAFFINETLAGLQKMGNYSKLSNDQRQILLEINLADQYFQSKKRAEILASELEIKEKEMYSIKHELIDAQLKLEKLEKEMQETDKK